MYFKSSFWCIVQHGWQPNVEQFKTKTHQMCIPRVRWGAVGILAIKNMTHEAKCATCLQLDQCRNTILQVNSWILHNPLGSLYDALGNLRRKAFTDTSLFTGYWTEWKERKNFRQIIWWHFRDIIGCHGADVEWSKVTESHCFRKMSKYRPIQAELSIITNRMMQIIYGRWHHLLPRSVQRRQQIAVTNVVDRKFPEENVQWACHKSQ